MDVKTIYQVWLRSGLRTYNPSIMEFTILVDAFLLSITVHSLFLTDVSCRYFVFWKLVNLMQFCTIPTTPGILKFTLYVPVVLKMFDTKFEKNWYGGYQKNISDIHLLTDDGGLRSMKTRHSSVSRDLKVCSSPELKTILYRNCEIHEPWSGNLC